MTCRDGTRAMLCEQKNSTICDRYCRYVDDCMPKKRHPLRVALAVYLEPAWRALTIIITRSVGYGQRFNGKSLKVDEYTIRI